MEGERKPEEILARMDELLEEVQDESLERTTKDSKKANPYAEHHRKVIKRGAKSESDSENTSR